MSAYVGNSIRAFSWWVLVVVGLLLGGELAPVAAQPVSSQGQGTVQLGGWPPNLREAGQHIKTELQLLPEADSLSLSYRYQADERGVDFSFVLAWHPGARALYQGRIVPFSKLPEGVRMTAIEVEAQAEVDGRPVARMLIGVDSLSLAPHPDIYSFEVPDVSYETVFLDTSPDSARAYFDSGVTLRDLQVRRIAFAVPRQKRRDSPRQGEARLPRQSSPSWSIYAPRVDVVIGWRVGPRPYYIGDRPPAREWRPRRSEVGRTADEGRGRTDSGQRGDARSGRTGDRGEDTSDSGRGKNSSRGDKDDDNDDDDDDSLLPAGGVALAAVGIAALAGGTVGYHGTGRTPLGLMAGWVRPKGGTLLQASINSAVLGANDGREHLVVKGMGFYDVFKAPVQPAIGVGAMATAEGDDTTVEPSVSVGAALNLGRVILIGAYDVIEQNPEIGIAVNFRFPGKQKQ